MPRPRTPSKNRKSRPKSGAAKAVKLSARRFADQPRSTADVSLFFPNPLDPIVGCSVLLAGNADPPQSNVSVTIPQYTRPPSTTPTPVPNPPTSTIGSDNNGNFTGSIAMPSGIQPGDLVQVQVCVLDSSGVALYCTITTVVAQSSC
jgi:hypothetical protein